MFRVTDRLKSENEVGKNIYDTMSKSRSELETVNS